MTTDVDFAMLRRRINLILDHIEIDLDMAHVTLGQDDYWYVLSPDKFDVLVKPTQFGIGKLSDDWDFMKRKPEDRREAGALMLIHVAPLLECIGEQVGQ